MPKTKSITTTVIGLYRSGLTSNDRLENTSIGRDDIVSEFIDKLKSRTNSHQHTVFIGPRGVGKTHLISLIINKVNVSQSLLERYAVIRFPEENNRILTFADFLLGVAEILGDVTNDQDWKDLFNRLQEEKDDDIIIDTILPKITAWNKFTKKTLLITIENLDALFTQQMKNIKSIHQLRSFLMDNPAALFIGTSPVFFPGLNDIKHPLYDFFDVRVISELDEDQTFQLIRVNLEYDNCIDQIKIFDKLIPKIKAVHVMTGGNPRLILLLYGLIAHDNILDVKLQFEKLLDSITPFYQDRIKDLPPQERALLETMALMRSKWEMRTPGNIARKMRKSARQISSLLTRMVKSGYLLVEQAPDGDKRSKVYGIKEGFFDLWLAMSLSRVHRNRFPILAEYFEHWYSDKSEREKKRTELWERIKTNSGKITEQIQKETDELLGYLSDIGTKDEQAQSKLEIALAKYTSGDNKYFSEVMNEIKPLVKGNVIFTWMTDKMEGWISGEREEADIYQRFETMIEYWRRYRSGDLEKAAQIAADIGYDFSDAGLHQINITFMQDALDQTHEDKQKLPILLNMAKSQKISGEYDQSLCTLEKALTFSRKIGDKSGEGTTLNNISQVYNARSDYDTGLKYLKNSLRISQKIGDKSGECVMLNNISQIYIVRGDYDTALKYLEDSLKISQEISDKSRKGTALNNIGQIYKVRGDYNTAMKYLEDSLKIRQEIGDKSGEGVTLNNIGQIFKVRGDYDTALKYLEDSLKNRQEIGDKSGEGVTLNNIGQIFIAHGDYDTGTKYLEDSLKIRQEIGDKKGEGITLNNISEIYYARGDYDTALKYLEDSLKIRQEIGDKSGEGTTLNNIGQIYDTLGDYDTALKYLEDSLKIRQEIGDKSGEGVTLNNIGQIFKVRGEYDTALKYLEDSLKIGQEIGNKSGWGTTLNNISQIYEARGDYDTALKYLENSLEVSREIGDKRGICVTLYNLGHIYMVNKKHAKAFSNWVTVYKIANKIGEDQVLQNLKNLAIKLGGKGLEFWEELVAKEK